VRRVDMVVGVVGWQGGGLGVKGVVQYSGWQVGLTGRADSLVV